MENVFHLSRGDLGTLKSHFLPIASLDMIVFPLVYHPSVFVVSTGDMFHVDENSSNI